MFCVWEGEKEIVCVRVCVCVYGACVCVRERERDREKARECVFVFVCVCERVGFFEESEKAACNRKRERESRMYLSHVNGRGG